MVGYGRGAEDDLGLVLLRDPRRAAVVAQVGRYALEYLVALLNWLLAIHRKDQFQLTQVIRRRVRIFRGFYDHKVLKHRKVLAIGMLILPDPVLNRVVVIIEPKRVPIPYDNGFLLVVYPTL